MILIFDQDRASRWRISGSLVCAAARVAVGEDLRRTPCWNRRCPVVAEVPRSKPSVVMATFHPLFTPPTTFSLGQRALVKKTSLNSARAVDLLDGADLDARLLHGHEEVGDAGVLGRVGVGAGQQEDVVGVLGLGGPHLLAVDDPLVAVELGPRLEAGQVDPGVGLAEPLAPRRSCP